MKQEKPIRSWIIPPKPKPHTPWSLAKSFLGRWRSLTVGAVMTAIGYYSLIKTLEPHLAAVDTVMLDNRNPFDTSFVFQNDGQMAARFIDVLCIDALNENGRLVLIPPAAHYALWRPKIDHSEKASVPCEAKGPGLPPVIPDGSLARVELIYSLSYYPFARKQVFEFRSERAEDGSYRWRY